MLEAFSLYFLSLFLVLAEFNCYANAGLLFTDCSDDHYYIGSTYESNLFELLSSLSADAQTNSAFSSQSFGQSPDGVYGLVMCYADYTQAQCFDCLHSVTSNTSQPCSVSTTATVIYDECLLSYSSLDYLSSADQYEPDCASNDTGSLTEEQQISLMKLLANLSATAPYAAERFSTGKLSGIDISALVQRTKDMSPEECDMCISTAMSKYFSSCSCNGTASGMRIMGRNCYIRYESFLLNVSSFPKSLVPPPPPPLPPPPSPLSLPPPPTVASPTGGSTMTIVVSVTVASVVAVLAVFGFCFWRRKRSSHKDTNDDDTTDHHENVEPELEYILNPNAEYQVFNFTTLKIATDNFSDMNKLGKGGFGPVYKGTLPDGREIAVKRLSGSSVQGITEFRNEVDFLAKLKHKNLVQLLGCCVTKQEKLLCYEYLPNGSLDKILFEKDTFKRAHLGWEVRHKIIEGITRGLHYLHEESRLKIIHRDLKVSNILLDKDMNPKISDFGLARFFGEDETHKDTHIIAGTFGYMAPEYILHGNISARSDVYSFGVLLLEILTGQKNSSFNGSTRISNFIGHAFLHWNNGTMSEFKDPILEEEFLEEIKRCAHVALLCVQEIPFERPNMETVKNILGNPTLIIPDLPSISWLTDSHLRENNWSWSTSISTAKSHAETSTPITSSVKTDQTESEFLMRNSKEVNENND